MASHQTQKDPDKNGVTRPNSQAVVVMVPLPAQGHLNQLLQLSRRIASYDMPVHYVGTATHNRQARVRAHGVWDPLSISNIHFHEFPVPSFATPPPNPDASNKFPSQLIPSMNASLNLRGPVCELVQQLSSEAKRVIVIFDSLMVWVVQDIPSIPNAEAYCFRSCSAFTAVSFYFKILGKSIPAELEILKILPMWEDFFTSEFLEFASIHRETRKKFNHEILYNTCEAIEGPFLDLKEREQVYTGNKLWAIGPFNPVVISEDLKSSESRHECLDWLDKQAPNSVLFVSFGTTTSLSDQQIRELAIGLERSEKNFVWVLRDADRSDVFVAEDRKAPLPEGFEERIKGRGIVVRDWAPQLGILGHGATGGFMSHCGWNSCMESISMGVPIAAWPMHSDQPTNAILITEVLKIGLIVKDWARSEQLVTSTMIEDCVKKLMASPQGDEMRQKAAELSNAIKHSVKEGTAMDCFIDHITR